MPLVSILRRLRVLAWTVLLLFGGPAAGAEPPPLSSLRAVAESFLEPAPHGPVDVEAVVTAASDRDTQVWLRDETAATFASLADGQIPPEPGCRVRVRGKVYEGAFINGIVDATLEILARDPAPAPRPVGPASLASGRFHHDRVSVAGVVRSARYLHDWKTTIVLNVDGGTMEVRLDWWITDAEVDRLVNAEVQIVGIGAGETNAARQMLRAYVRVIDPADMVVTAAADGDPFMAPLVPLERIGVVPHGLHRVRVVGVATARGGVGDGVFLAARDRGLFVAPATLDAATLAITPGDLVEAVGFPTPGPAAVTLGDARLRVVGRAPIPSAPRLPDLDSGPLSGSEWRRLYQDIWRDALPLEVEIDLASRLERDGRCELVGSTPVRAVTIRCVAPPVATDVVPGSRVRVRGVGRVTATSREAAYPMPTAFDVWAEAAADVSVVRAAPWWMRPGLLRTLAVTAGGTSLAAAAAAIWAVMLRWQVRSQTGQLAAEIRSRRNAAIEFEATLRERNRLAANLHDTLLQTLGGIGFQLDACEGSQGADESRLHFGVARRMVNHAANELHNSVWTMRSLPIRDQTFPEALHTLCGRVGEGHAARIDVHTEGRLDDVPEFVAGTLLLIIQEAVLNALRHGRAAIVTVRVADRPMEEAIAVEVRDDGRGFDTSVRQGLEQGHFGIQGMRERVDRLGGTLEIASHPGRGTTVRARVRRREFDADLAPPAAAP